MKLFYDLSKLEKSTTFKHDANLIKGVQIGITVFLILSSTTVFSGVRSHLSDYLIDSFFLWRWFVLGGSYFIGSLGIDLVNTVCLAYVVSAILRKDFERESIVLILFCSLLSVGLTYYSFSMSQNSAVIIGNDIGEEKQTDDSNELTRIDTVLNNQLAAIEANYKENYNRTTEPFKTRIENVSKSYDNQIEILKNEIAVIDANTTKDNYLYAAKQKKPITAQLQDLEAAKLVSLSPILTEQQNAIDLLTAQKNSSIEDVRQFHKSDRGRTKSKTDSHNDQAEVTSTIFSDLFSKLSGYAVFALLILAAIREVLFFRNDIEPEPILSNFDFSPAWSIEVISYPLVWMRRHSVNKVRAWYEDLPELKQPVIQDKIYDGKSLNQDFVKLKPKQKANRDNDRRPMHPAGSPRYMPPGRTHNLQSSDYVFASVPVQSGAGGNEPINTISQYSHEIENSGGFENQLEPSKPTKPETHEIPDSEVQKIEHIGKNKQSYWYDKKQVEGKVTKYVAAVREWRKKAARAKATNRDKRALENNEQLLSYWQGRLNEF